MKCTPKVRNTTFGVRFTILQMMNRLELDRSDGLLRVCCFFDEVDDGFVGAGEGFHHCDFACAGEGVAAVEGVAFDFLPFPFYGSASHFRVDEPAVTRRTAALCVDGDDYIRGTFTGDSRHGIGKTEQTRSAGGVEEDAFLGMSHFQTRHDVSVEPLRDVEDCQSVVFCGIFGCESAFHVCNHRMCARCGVAEERYASLVGDFEEFLNSPVGFKSHSVRIALVVPYLGTA